MPWLHLHLGHICTYRCLCIKYVCVIYIWSIYFAYSLWLGFFVCLFKPLIKFWHSRFLFSGVQGQGLKDACRVQNTFLGKKKRRKTTLQKQTAPMTCPSVSHKEFLANTMHAFVVGLCQAYHSLQNFPSGPVHTHRHEHSQSVSRYCDYSYDRSWLGCMPRQKFDVAWRAVFRYAVCCCRAFRCEEVTLLCDWLRGAVREEGVTALPSLSLFADTEGSYSTYPTI